MAGFGDADADPSAKHLRTASAAYPPKKNREVPQGGAGARQAWASHRASGATPVIEDRERFGARDLARCQRLAPKGLRLGGGKHRGSSKRSPEREHLHFGVCASPRKPPRKWSQSRRIASTQRPSASANRRSSSRIPLDRHQGQGRLRTERNQEVGGTVEGIHMQRCGCWTWWSRLESSTPLTGPGETGQLLREWAHPVGSKGCGCSHPRSRGRQPGQCGNQPVASVRRCGPDLSGTAGPAHSPRRRRCFGTKGAKARKATAACVRDPDKVEKPKGASSTPPAAT